MVHRLQFDLSTHGRLTVLDDALYGLDSTDNVSRYDGIFRVPSRAASDYTAKRSVTVEDADGTIRSCLFVFPSGGGLYETNVLLHDSRLFLASGVALIAIDIATLKTAWTVDLQSGADNGIHFITPERVLAIGDFDATLLDWSGSIIWAENIPGFLVPPAIIEAETFTIEDDDGRSHRVLLANGKCIAG